MNPRLPDVDRLAQTISVFANRAVAEYAPLVEALVRDQCRDARCIERTLDGLLDFCFHPQALLLFKKLGVPGTPYEIHTMGSGDTIRNS